MSIQHYEIKAHMSRAVIHQNTAYLCGQVAENANVDIKEQTRSVLSRIEDLLANVGTNKKKLLSVTIYIRDMKDFSAMNEIWDQWVEKSSPPARACVEAKMARPELLVEMSCIAAIS